MWGLWFRLLGFWFEAKGLGFVKFENLARKITANKCKVIPSVPHWTGLTVTLGNRARD